MNGMTAVSALVMRDLRGVARSRSQLYSSILFPLMLLAILGNGVSEGLDPQNVDDYVTFLTPGIIVMTALFSSTFSSATYYADRDTGMLDVMYASPHPARLVLLSKVASSVIIGMLQAVAVLAVAAMIPAIDFEWQYGVVPSLAVALATIVLLNIMLAGMGQALASRIGSMTGFHLVMNLVLFPLLFFSGAFFPLEDLPLWLRILGTANPLSYAVDALQLALWADDSTGQFGLAVDFVVLGALTAVAAWLGTMRQEIA